MSAAPTVLIIPVICPEKTFKFVFTKVPASHPAIQPASQPCCSSLPAASCGARARYSRPEGPVFSPQLTFPEIPQWPRFNLSQNSSQQRHQEIRDDLQSQTFPLLHPSYDCALIRTPMHVDTSQGALASMLVLQHHAHSSLPLPSPNFSCIDITV